MEIVSTYTREDAIRDHVLIDIKAPLFSNGDSLYKMLGHNKSICMTTALIELFLEYCDESVSIEDHIKSMVTSMIETVQSKREDKEQLGSVLIFDFALVAEKISKKLKIKSVTHIEPSFMKLENVKCITFMMENES